MNELHRTCYLRFLLGDIKGRTLKLAVSGGRKQNAKPSLVTALKCRYPSGVKICTQFVVLIACFMNVVQLARASNDAADEIHQAKSAVITQPHGVTSGLKEVGRGEMDWLWFDLYRAILFTPDGRYPEDVSQQGFPQVLDIEYYRAIDSNDLVEATLDQWRHLGIATEIAALWQTHLASLWPNVQQGDHLSFKLYSADQGEFYFNGRSIGIVDEAGFAQGFLAIWLSNETSRPKLRAQLLGEKKCDC